MLELSGRNHCVNERFSNANQKLHEIEGKISRQCEYEPFPDEALVTQNLMDDANRRIDLDEIKIKMPETKLTEANDKINNLMKEFHENQEKWQKLEESVKNFKEMETKISSLEEKHVKKLNDQQKEFDAMISSERVNVDAKITEMETKLSTQKIELHECKSDINREVQQMEAKITKMETKLSVQKMDLQRYSDEIEITCESKLLILQRTMTTLQEKVDRTEE